jgi:exopolysaccharide biosynthesis protein
MSRPRRNDSGRGFRNAVCVTVVVVLIGVISSSAAPLSMIVAARDASAASATTSVDGLHIYAINGRQYGVRTAIHVLAFSGSQYTLKIGLAKGTIDGGTQTPSTMCRITAGCVAAVNGDFFDLSHPGAPDPGDEVGGIIQNCVLLHTPQIAHQQADLDGQSVSNGLEWSSTVDVNGTSVPITAINQELPISYAQVHLPLAGTLLFTPPYALQIPSAAGRVTYEFAQVDGTTSPTTINTTAELDFVAQTVEPVKVRAGQVFISAPAGSSLATLQVGDTVTLTTTSTAGCDSIGGHPILLNHGVVTPIVPADTYMVKPYARTVIGWTASGGTVIMTVDGKDGVSGATAHQLVSLLQYLNVVTALDLDGGNSTTLYANGHVLNRPSHGTERPVSTGLLIVANP